MSDDVAEVVCGGHSPRIFFGRRDWGCHDMFWACLFSRMEAGRSGAERLSFW
jgi:hypothetical protein